MGQTSARHRSNPPRETAHSSRQTVLYPCRCSVINWHAGAFTSLLLVASLKNLSLALAMESNTTNSARFRSDGVRDGVLRLAIEGHLDVDTTGGIWRQATNTIVRAKSSRALLA